MSTPISPSPPRFTHLLAAMLLAVFALCTACSDDASRSPTDTGQTHDSGGDATDAPDDAADVSDSSQDSDSTLDADTDGGDDGPRLPDSYRIELLEAGTTNQPSCEPNGINDDGVIVGECCPSTSSSDICDCVGFVYDDGFETLSPPEGYDGVTPMTINAQGDIAGALWKCDESNEAFVRPSGEAIRNLNGETGIPSEYTLTRVVHLNDDGQAAGWFVDGESTRAFRYDPSSNDGFAFSAAPVTASYIDDEGVLYGAAQKATDGDRAMSWDPSGTGGVAYLSDPEVDNLKRTAANEARGNRVIGYGVSGELTANFVFAMLWEDGQPHLLPNGDERASALELSPEGVPIGTCTFYDEDVSARFSLGCFWEAGQRHFFEDRVINPEAWQDSLWHVGGTEQINGQGVLVGRAYDKTREETGIYRLFTLTPVTQ